MQKIIIGRIIHSETKKDGTPYINRNGKPYTRVSILTKDSNSQEVWVSGFGSQITKGWQQRQEVEVELEKSGDYWNFKVPNEGDKKLSDLEARVSALEVALLELNKKTTSSPQETEVIAVPFYPPVPDEIDIDSIPF